MKDDALSVQNAIATINATREALRQSIADKEGQRAQLQKEIADLNNAPISFNDWLPFLREWIKQRAKKPSGGILQVNLIDRMYTKPLNEKGWLTHSGDLLFHGTQAPDQQPITDVFGALCFYFPEVVYDKLSEHYRESVGDQWGNDDLPTIGERKAMIAKMEKRIAALDADLKELNEQLGRLVID